MNTKPENKPADDDKASSEEFMAWLKADPANVKKLVMQMRRVAAGEFGDLTPEIMDAAKLGIQKHKEQAVIEGLTSRIRNLMERVSALADGEGGREQVPELVALADTLTDDMLDMPEPHRTKLTGMMVDIRDRIRAV